MTSLVVTSFLIGGGLMGFLFLGFLLAAVSPKFKKWFDSVLWGGESDENRK